MLLSLSFYRLILLLIGQFRARHNEGRKFVGNKRAKDIFDRIFKEQTRPLSNEQKQKTEQKYKKTNENESN